MSAAKADTTEGEIDVGLTGLATGRLPSALAELLESAQVLYNLFSPHVMGERAAGRVGFAVDLKFGARPLVVQYGFLRLLLKWGWGHTAGIAPRQRLSESALSWRWVRSKTHKTSLSHSNQICSCILPQAIDREHPASS